MSFATFCRLRPRHFSLTRYTSKNRCLCQKHQNMALLLKAARTAGVDVPPNPEDYAKKVKDIDLNCLLSRIQESDVAFEQWQKVDCSDGKKRMKVVERHLSKTDFFVR